MGRALIGGGTAVAVAARTMPATPPTVLSTATTVGHAADTHIRFIPLRGTEQHMFLQTTQQQQQP